MIPRHYKGSHWRRPPDPRGPPPWEREREREKERERERDRERERELQREREILKMLSYLPEYIFRIKHFV